MKSSPSTRPGRPGSSAFTLIEIMVVVAIMALIITMGFPSIYHLWNKQGIQKAVEDTTQACINARARAILTGTMAELVFHPRENRFEISGGGANAATSPASDGKTSGVYSEDIKIEMLDINLLEYNQSEVARIRFFPNGTSDELTLILHSGKDEWRKITLEITTGLATAGPVTR